MGRMALRRFKAKKCAVFLLILSLLLCACACGHKLTEGEVYEKEHREAETKVMMIPLVTSNGKTTNVRIVPYVYYYPERWVVRIREPNGDGTYTSDEYYTTKEVYESVEVGYTFSYDPDRDFEHEPYERDRQAEKE